MDTDTGFEEVFIQRRCDMNGTGDLKSQITEYVLCVSNTGGYKLDFAERLK
jgi:hypothetical protein